MALKEFSGDLIQEPKLKEFSGELDASDSQGNAYTNAYKKLWGKLVQNGNDLRDVAAATLKIGPTALKGVGDLAQLVTGGNYGTGISNAMTEGMQAIDDVVGSPELRAQKQNVNTVLNDPTKGIGDLASAVIDNPRAAVDAGVSTIGSLFIPAGAAKAVTLIPKVANSGKAATAAAIGTGGAMNAADTFTSIDSPDLGDKYTGAAISGLTSLGVGALTGGGAEGLIAKKIANDPSIRQAASNVFARLFGQPLKTMGKEGLQEAGEASGNYLGEVVGDGKEFNANQLGKRAAYEGALGAILGGGVGAATNTGGQPPGITIIGNPAPQPANPQAAANVANLIADTATMDSKLKPAPADIELTDTAQPTQDQPVDLNVAPTPDPTPATDDKIIQNRNRATPSSIAQMTAISAAPDYNRLSFSRDFANGAPVVAGGVIPAEQLGASDVAVASDGRRIPVQYAVVDASELLPSNQADGTENAAFYDNTIDAVRAIAGNGRIAGLQAAYGKNTADAYRTELEADTLHGIDPQVIAGMANPVLVRVMPQESVTADIGDVSNTVGNLELSPVEQANNDVQRVNLEALSFADDGSVTPQAVRQFVQAMPQAEQGSLLDTNGQPTKQAVDRLNAAIFAKAYNNDKLIRLYAQAQDAEARVVLSALAQVAPKMARLEGAGQLDIRQAVTDAAEIAVNARRNGLSITRAAQQVDITADPNVVEVLTLFAANVRSSKAVAEALGRAADFAYSEAIKPAEDMFGEVPKASRQEVFNQLGNTDEPASTQDLPDAQGAGGVSQDPARAAVFSRGQGDANGAGEGGSVNDTTARQDAADYGLDSYTNRDIVERLDRIEKSQKEAAERAKAEEAKRQADLERDTFGLTGSESPTDRLEAQGQGRLFQNPEAYNGQYGRQIDFFLDYGSDASQDSSAGDAAKRQASTAVDDLRSSGSVLGKALSSDYATGQRTTLVGREAKTAEDLATLAQVYRDPRFETFRMIFVNDAGRVLSQVGLTSRLPTSTQAIMGDDLEAYLEELSKVAKQRGATGYWMLHNHPSGQATPSNADVQLTKIFGESVPGLTNKGHVVIDTNEYATISDKPIYREVGNEQDPNKSFYRVTQKDFGAVQPMTAGEFSLQRIRGAEDAMRIVKKLDVDHGSVTIIGLDAQMRVQRISAVPSSAFGEDRDANHRVLLKESLSNKTYRVIIVGRDRTVLENAGRSATDAIHIANDGTVSSLSASGQAGWKELYPSQRRTRVSPDTSPEFDYLRNVPTAQQLAAVREEEADFGPVLTQYRGNAQGAIQKLLELRTGDAEAALSHPDIGDIDLIYGKAGDPKYDYRDGFGLGKIAGKHPEVLADLQNIVAGMRITLRSENRINLESATHKGAVRLEWNGQRKTWLLTAFEKVADGANTRTDTIGLNGEGDTARSAAAASDIVANNADKANLRQMPPEYDNPQADMNVPPSGMRFDPIRIGDWVKTERGATGRRQYVAGRKLWDRAAGYANEYLGKLKLADTKPGAFKEMLRQFNVDKTKASQQAKRIAETGMDLTPEQRAMLSDLIEKQSAMGDVPPQEIVDLAATMTAALDVQARELVDLGMLSEDRLVKNYLPRLYKNGLAGMLTNPTLMRSWFAKARMRIRGDRLKSRGMFTELPVSQVAQAKKLGWKVSGMMDGAPLPDDLLKGLETDNIHGKYADAKIVMWRDYTQDEREQMGEIRDGILRYALGYVETQKDIAIGRLFKAIASNSDLAKDHNPGGWVKVPDQEIKGAPGTKAYGVLSGMWVEPQVADSLKRNTQPKGMLMAAYDKALSFWKEGKTVWNPVAHGNNVVSNLFTIHFAGINPANPKAWRETLREYRTKGKYYNEALDNGLFGNEWANQEIQDMLMPDFADMASLEDVAASRVSKVIDLAKKAGKPVSWYREKMQKAYEFEDQFFKLMLYIDRRKAGMDPQEAITDAERYVFNYADMPEGVELIKRTASPFFAYTYKAIPMVLHTAMTRPDRMLAPIALLGGANWLAYMILGADEEEERKAMPEYMKGRTFIGTQKAIRLPFNIDDRPAFLDMSRRVPLGDLFDINNQTNGLPIPAPFMPSHPVLSMLQAVVYNQDTFTGRDLVKKSDTGWEAAQARAGYMVRQFMPNAPFVPGSYNFNKLADATAYAFDTEIGPYTGYTKAGDPVRMATVLPDVMTGTKIRSFDPQRGLAYQAGDLDKEEREIRANIRSAGKNKAMTEEARQRYIEGQQEKLRRLGERRAELNE